MKTVRLLIVALIALGLFGYSEARAGTGVSDKFEPYSLYSGEYGGRQSGSYVAYRARVTVPGAVELRLFFGKVSLGNSSYILITSLEDSSQQHLSAATISQWNYSTAYFNGNAVEVELHVAPGDSRVFFNVDSVLVGTSDAASHGPDQTLTLVNNRTPSDDPAVGRLRDPANGNAEATAWIAANGYLVTAGHVAYLWSGVKNSSEQVLQFDVPNSQPDGTMNNPPAQDQYYIDQWIQYGYQTTTTGDDWAVFSVHPNSETGLYPIQAQQSYYEVEQNDNCSALQVTGYGNAGANSLNDTQQKATGADAGSSGQLLKYSVYISSGSSGSPVIDENTGKVVGIVDDFGNADYNVGTSMYNPGLWSYMQPITQTATVTQLLSDNTTTDPNLWQWNGSSFASLSPDSQITVTTGNPEVLKGDQSPDNGQKYNNWTLNAGPDYDVINPHKFLMMGTNFTSHLDPVYNATLESYLTDVGSTGFPVSFKDPWLIDYNDPTYGMSNRGMSAAPYESVPIATNNLGTGSSHQGVFLNQVPLVNNPNSPYYSVAAPATESYNGHTWAFWQWTGTGGSYFENPTATSTPVVFGSDGSTVSANYKGLQLSNDSTAYSRSGQTRFIRIPDGMLVQVYPDGGHVWAEYNSGSGWQPVTNGYPLDGTAGGKSPSIAWTNNGDNYYIAVVWQQKSGTGYVLKGTVINDLGGTKEAHIVPVQGTRTIFTQPADPYTDDAYPEIAVSPDLDYIVTFKQYSASGNFQPGIDWVAGPLPGNGVNDEMMAASTYGPSLVPGTNVNCTAAALAGDQYGQLAINAQLLFVENYKIYEQYLSAIYVNQQWYTSVNSSATYLDDYQPYDYDPSIVAIPYQQFVACWVDNISSTNVDGSWPQVDQMTYYASNTPSTIYYFGDGVQSCGIDLGWPGTNADGDGYAAWSQIYNGAWSNEALAYNAGAPNSQQIVSTGTSGKYIQLGNGDNSDMNNVYVSSFSPFTAPYSFSLSSDLGSIFGKTKRVKNPGNGVLSTAAGIVVGRGCIVNDGKASFLYRFGSLNVDGRNIGFVSAPGKDDYHKLNNVDSVLETQPFQVSQDSKVVFSERSGVSDSTAAVNALGSNGYVGCTVQVLDNATNKVLGTIRSGRLTSDDLHRLEVSSYRLSTAGIAGRTVRIRIVVSTNLDSAKTMLVKSYSLDNTALNSTTQSLSMQTVSVIKSFALDQNYPNPFNPTTVIDYTLPKAEHVTLTIYDVLGQEVETLVDQEQQVGRYSATFNGSSLASGVYFYRLIAGNHVITKKMLFIK